MGWDTCYATERIEVNSFWDSIKAEKLPFAFPEELFPATEQQRNVKPLRREQDAQETMSLKEKPVSGRTHADKLLTSMVVTINMDFHTE